MTEKPSCDHRDFHANVAVNRLTNVEGGPVVGYSADLTVECADCREPFCFRAPLGLSQFHPTVSFDGATLAIPLHPMSDPTAGIGLLGFSVSVHGASEAAAQACGFVWDGDDHLCAREHGHEGTHICSCGASR